MWLRREFCGLSQFSAFPQKNENKETRISALWSRTEFLQFYQTNYDISSLSIFAEAFLWMFFASLIWMDVLFNSSKLSSTQLSSYALLGSSHVVYVYLWRVYREELVTNSQILEFIRFLVKPLHCSLNYCFSNFF